jgi:DNA-binding winged helix-turn-helix (wHTH) protein
MRVRFGDCIFDSDTRELFHHGKPVHLAPKAFRLLELLVENRPRALSKEELLQQLWPKTYVSEGNLPGLAAEIRRAIGEGPEGTVLRTVYGYGYAFSAKTEKEKAEPPPARAATGSVGTRRRFRSRRARTSSVAIRPRTRGSTTRRSRAAMPVS